MGTISSGILGTTDILDGAITDVKIKAGAAIAKSKLEALSIPDVLGLGQKISNFDQLIKQSRPALQVLGTMDETTYAYMIKSGNDYILDPYTILDFYSKNNQSSDITFNTTNNRNAIGQAFTSGGSNAVLNAVQFYLSKTGNPLNNITAVLYAATGTIGTDGLPTGGALATSEPIASSTLTGSFALYTFIFSTPYNLLANTKYAISLENTPEAGATVLVGTDSTSPTHAGNTYHRDTAAYVSVPSHDTIFYTLTAIGQTSGNIFSNVIAADSAVLSFYKHLKLKTSNGGSTHATPVQAEIYGNADSYAAALHATKFTINPADPRIILKRDALDTITASSANQTVWNMTVAGGLPALNGNNHGTILATEIGVASILAVEKSILGDWTDTVVLAENTDYIIDYSTRTATKITLTSGAGIVNGQSKIRLTWISDIMKIDGATNNTALKCKLYLNRTVSGEASPSIQPIDLGSGMHVEMLYGT